jgi:predicted MPP superfamily phosphohydrolase
MTLLALHYYIAKRLVLDPGVPEPWRTGLLLALGFAAASLFLVPISSRKIPPSWSRVIAWPSAVWMGLGFCLLSLLGFSELLLGLARLVLASPLTPEVESSISVTRATTVAIGAAVAGGIALRSGLSPPRHKRVEIELERWPAALDRFRIVQITDIHIGKILGRRFAEHVVGRVNDLDPDLIAVTGDLADGEVRELADEVAPFGRLRARRGVFFVTGNHDHYSGVVPWVAKTAELGMRALRNERVEIREGDAVFDLVGVDDHRGSMTRDDGREDLTRALAERDVRRPAILLAHDPSTFRKASELDIDLQISGHTHGGQIWPFGYIVRLATPFVAGRYHRNGSQLYVSRGTGFWGPPMRLFAPSEITELVIRSASVNRRAFGAGGDEIEQPKKGSLVRL